jgi:hypothetical protein
MEKKNLQVHINSIFSCTGKEKEKIRQISPKKKNQ